MSIGEKSQNQDIIPPVQGREVIASWMGGEIQGEEKGVETKRDVESRKMGEHLTCLVHVELQLSLK